MRGPWNISIWKSTQPQETWLQRNVMTSAQIRQSFLDFFREKQHSIVPSSSLLPDSPNLLFTNAGMNQFVPIFLGQQKPAWNPPRVADTQKCIRAGGKHNDLEDVGLDTYHHTFFEMLGNWSFGDYFKKEAIEWAWELVVERWKLPPQRLYATVYKPAAAGEPSEFDEEAHDHWARLFREADLDPAIHIVNGDKADNFWMMGETGPCGPCSELHVDLTPDGDTRGALVNKDDPRCIEIWNLVFIQFNANPDRTFTALPQRHVDTGMGFERTTAIIQGTKNFSDFSSTISNYETDIFRPIFDELEKLSGQKYTSTLPTKDSGSGSAGDPPVGEGVSPSRTSSGESSSRRDPATSDRDGRATQIQIDIAFRVIADHIRTLSFAIADGIIPSNEGRGYVLRRILRRAVRYGRTLDFHEPFFYKLVDVVAQTMGDVFPEVRTNQSRINEAIKREEEAFNRTLDKGIALFEEKVSIQKAVPSRGSLMSTVANVGTEEEPEFVPAITGDRIDGAFAFLLYDTYGFPLDLTELMARERGLTVDRESFEKLMGEQRARGRAAQKKQIIELSEIETKEPTKFVGYTQVEAVSKVQEVALLQDRTAVVLAVSPCYPEMGGQVGDTGMFETSDISIAKFFRITDTRKLGNTWIHFIEDELAPNAGSTVIVRVDVDRRHAIERHHTVTHILHWALHELVSRDATQKGSYVGPDKLTFDFSSAALTQQQKCDVEKLVNEKVDENAAVSWTEIPYAEAKKRPDIQQFFGDKYGDTVRVVQIGGQPKALNGYSMELCGGTHVRTTGDIGSFRIVREEAIAAGVRRVEAVAGDAARDWAREEATRQQEKFEALARKKSDIAALPAFSNKGETAEMLKQIDARAAHLEKLDAEVREREKQNAKVAGAEMQSRAASIAKELAESCEKKDFCVAEVPNADGKLLGAVADVLRTKFKGPIFLAGAIDGRVALIASVPKEMTSKFQANKLIQETAAIVGGKGGGRPESAQGGGTDGSKINQALDKAKKTLAS
jgi:alanyl-tRNA synthetase